MSSDGRWIEFMWCANDGCQVAVIVPWAFRPTVKRIFCAACVDDLECQDYDRIVAETVDD